MARRRWRKISKKTEKKEEKLALETEEDAAKKTHVVVDFKPSESVGFQNGFDTNCFFPRIFLGNMKSDGVK